LRFSRSVFMRRISSTLIGLSIAAGFWACSSTSDYKNDPLQELDAVNAAGPTSGVGPTVTTTINSGTGTTDTVSGVTNGTTSTMSSSATAGTTGGASTTGSSVGAGGNASTGNGATTGGPACTDTPPDDRETCATWKEWGEC